VSGSIAGSAFNEFTRPAVNGRTELMSLLKTQDVAACVQFIADAGCWAGASICDIPVLDFD